jgi:hypothetical protein
LSVLVLVSDEHIRVAAGNGDSGNQYRYDGSPVEPYTAGLIDDLILDGFVELATYSDRLTPTSSGWDHLAVAR